MKCIICDNPIETIIKGTTICPRCYWLTLGITIAVIVIILAIINKASKF